MMQNILDKQLGVDREKLKEIDAMMEELEKMKEKIIEESLEIKKQAKETFTQDEIS